MKKSLLIVIATLLFHRHAVAKDLNVPKGFEELATGQVLWLEVLLYGFSLGLYEAQVDLDNVQFLKPDDVANAIKSHPRSPSAPDNTPVAGIRSPLKRNGHLACSTNGRAPGCDYLTTESLAIIYDENEAKVRLFLGSQHAPRAQQKDTYYQASPESRNALVHQQNVNLVADGNYQSASIRGNGAVGVTQNSYVNVDWNWQGQRYRGEQRQQADVSNAFFRHDLAKRHYVQGGLMDSRDIFTNAGGNINLSQLPISRIHGVRAGSTLAWTNQDARSQGTPVVVFLTQEARVDAFRDDKLLSSFYLGAGSHELDTRNFPAGSYTVTLRIFENNQLVRTESVPYTHVGNAQSSTTQWFMQSGQLADASGTQQDANRSIAQGGVRVPVTGNLALTAGSALLNNHQFWESALDWRHGFNSGPINGVLTTKASYLYGSDGSRGNTQQIGYHDGFSLSAYRSQMTSPDCDNATASQYSFKGCYSSTSVMLSAPISQWSTRVGYTLNHNQGRYLTRSQLPTSDREHDGGAPWEQVFVTRARSQAWQAGVSRAFSTHGAHINTSINAFMRNDSGASKTDRGGFLSATISRTRNPDGKDRRSTASVGGSWQTSRNGSDQLGYTASYSQYQPDRTINNVGGSLTGLNTDTVTASAWGSGDGRYGEGSLNLNSTWQNSQNRHTSSVGGSYNSSLLIDRSGLSWGRWGDGTPSSAITVALDNQDEDSATRVEASLTTGAQADVGSNGKALLMVPGYQQTTLNITESAEALSGAGSTIHKGAGSKPLFMPPGRVVRHEVTASSRYTWLGTLADEHHQPLTGGRPLNVASWTPFSDGGFMMETHHLMKTLYVIKDDTFWQCRLDVKTLRDVVRDVGTTPCHPTDIARLPDAEKKQASLMLTRAEAASDPQAKQG